VPIQIEVMLPAFCLGMVTYDELPDGVNTSFTSEEYNKHIDHYLLYKEEMKPDDSLTSDELVHFIVSSGFMVFVGLSMPPVFMTSDKGVIA